ncbi:hypothetical protein [Nocardia brevicatena]|nr:hypothetical protein [Nocardia brevicatena]
MAIRACQCTSGDDYQGFFEAVVAIVGNSLPVIGPRQLAFEIAIV